MEEHKEEKKERRLRFPFKIKLNKSDIVAIAALIIFLVAVSIPAYVPKTCEVTRPNFKCVSFKDVMIENCDYWGKYNCDTTADASLPDVEWYIRNICESQNKFHNTGLDCSNLKSSCNQITGTQTCPLGYLG